MPFTIVRNDITKVTADAIVNTANPQVKIGTGTDSAIYKAAGAEELLAARREIGDIEVGKAAATPAFALPAKYVIHTVGPSWTGGGQGEREALRSCYEESLKLAAELGCESIAFPLIATGVYGFPKDLAMRTATSAIYDFLMENDMQVYLVVFDRMAYELSGKLFEDVRAYIDGYYVAEKADEEYAKGVSHLRNERRGHYYRHLRKLAEEEIAAGGTGAGAGKATAAGGHGTATAAGGAGPFSQQIKATEGTFQEHLLQLVIASGMKNPEIYNGANISKQHFSKIMSDKNWNPKKNTVCALAISLHLTLEEAELLLKKAGFVLTPSSRFDLAVRYFLLNKKYDIVEDNIMLYDNDLEQLGTQ